MTYGSRERFDELTASLSKWREDDHEDNIAVCRSHVIELLDGIRRLDATIGAVSSISNELSWNKKTRPVAERITTTIAAGWPK